MPWCFREHVTAVPYKHDEGPRHHPLPLWFICCWVRSSFILTHLLVALGVLCADSDGGLLYWRLRFWRPSLHRSFAWRQVREHLAS